MELQAQASRAARELAEARSALLREKGVAVAAAVSAKAREMKAAEDKAVAALTAKLEVKRIHESAV